MSDVNIKYKNSSIASMDASGTKTLLTEGKYCEDDIEVIYTRPSTPSPSLQSKTRTYTPSSSQQTETITADAGYDGLSQVDVTVMRVITNNIIASNIRNGITIQVGDSSNPSRIASVTGTYDGGGGDGDEVFIVYLSTEDDELGNITNITADVSYPDIEAEFQAGKIVLADLGGALYKMWFDDIDDVFTCSFYYSRVIEFNGEIVLGVQDMSYQLFSDGSEDLWQGATFWDVESMPLPDAQPEDVASGCYFFNSSGIQIGTA